MRSALTIGAALGLGLAPSVASAAPARCKGTKVWYAGDCRYPDEVEGLKAQQAAEQRAREQRRRADAAGCAQARAADTIAAWQRYLSDHGDGQCRDEASERLRTLMAEPSEAPADGATPAPTAPPPPAAPAPPPAQPSPSSSEGLSPLVWVGFGLCAAGWLTWAVTGGISLSMSSDIKDDCPGDVCPPEREGDIDEAKALAHVASVGFAVGAVGAAVGTIALVLSSDGDAAAQGGAQARAAAGSLELRVGAGSFQMVGAF